MVGAASAPLIAFGSSHREAPLISDDPAADNTDVYAWVTPGSHDKLNIVANYVPLEEPAGGPNFHKLSDHVRYSIHISRGDSLDEQFIYRVRCRTNKIQRVDPADKSAGPGGGKEFFIQLSGQVQTCRVIKLSRKKGGGWSRKVIGKNISVAPVNIGPRSHQFANGQGSTYDDAFASTFIHPLGDGGEEGRVFIGPRDDGFYVDLGGVFDLANLRAKAKRRTASRASIPTASCSRSRPPS